MTEVEQLIRAWSDCNKASDLSGSGQIATDLTKEQLTKYKNKYKHCQKFGVGQRSESRARDLEPARGQGPTAEDVNSFRLTQLTELSQLHISSGYSESATFWSVKKPRCYHITYTWHVLFTLSIPFNQPSLAVSWPFYNIIIK